MYHDLKSCMSEDDEALYMWGKTLEHLARGEEELFQKTSGEAKQLSDPLFEACKESGKYAIVNQELSQWFVDFWTQPDAIDQMMGNIEAHPMRVKLSVLGARVAWALGWYYPAGKAYGKFWRHLMGTPEWNADLSSTKVHPIKSSDKAEAAAILNSNSFYALTGQDFRKEIQACVIPDALEFEVLDAMIGELKDGMTKEDKMTFLKYLEAAKTMDKFNYGPCEGNKELISALTDFVEDSDMFWKQKDIEGVIAGNIEA